MAARLHCSFCRRSDAEVRKLVAGAGGGYICDACASIAVRIMAESDRPSVWARIRAQLRKPIRRAGPDFRLRADARFA